MAKRGGGGDDDDGGLDSLLDTMTNVVGILVIVLVVTQLGVGDAVQRIAESDQVTPEALEAVTRELDAANTERTDLTNRLDDLKPVDTAELQRRLELLQRQIDQRTRMIQNAKRTANQFTIRIEDEEKKAEQAKQEIAKLNKNRDELKKQLDEKLAAVARSEAILDETPERRQLPTRIVSIPNPRPAPTGAKAVMFICTGNKVYPLNLDNDRDPKGLRTLSRLRAEGVVARRRLDANPAQGVNADAFFKEYAKLKPVRDDYFDVQMTKHPTSRSPKLTFVPRANGGVTEKELTSPRSAFRRFLASVVELQKRTGKTTMYARFFVLPDSYDIYITARSVFAEEGMLAGWEPQNVGWQYTTVLGGGKVLFGPPPPPNPNPPPPRPPGKPANLID